MARDVAVVKYVITYANKKAVQAHTTPREAKTVNSSDWMRIATV